MGVPRGEVVSDWRKGAGGLGGEDSGIAVGGHDAALQEGRIVARVLEMGPLSVELGPHLLVLTEPELGLPDRVRDLVALNPVTPRPDGRDAGSIEDVHEPRERDGLLDASDRVPDRAGLRGPAAAILGLTVVARLGSARVEVSGRDQRDVVPHGEGIRQSPLENRLGQLVDGDADGEGTALCRGDHVVHGLGRHVAHRLGRDDDRVVHAVAQLEPDAVVQDVDEDVAVPELVHLNTVAFDGAAERGNGLATVRSDLELTGLLVQLAVAGVAPHQDVDPAEEPATTNLEPLGASDHLLQRLDAVLHIFGTFCEGSENESKPLFFKYIHCVSTATS